MSGIGIPQSGLANVLSLARPDLLAEQQALQTRRAFAQSLLGQQPQFQGPGGALDTLGSKILGAFLTRNANKQSLDIANQQRDALFGSGGLGLQPEQASAPPLASLQGQDIAPQAGQPNTGVQAATLPPLGSMPKGGLPSAPAPQQQQVAQAQPVAVPQAAQHLSLFDRVVPDIPGLDNSDKLLRYGADPAGYMKAYYAAVARPDAVKTALFANNGDTAAAQRDIAAQNTKAGTLEFREKGFGVLPSGKVIYGPNEESNTYFTTGPNNEPIAHAIQGGAEVAAQQAAAIERAKERNKILPDVETSTGAHVPMFGDVATGDGQSSNLGARNNNPLNMQPGGQEANYRTPTAGFGAAWDNLSDYGRRGINTVNSIIKTWAPDAPPQYAASVAQAMKVSPDQALNLNDPNIKGELIDAMKPNETGKAFTQAPSQPQQSPAPQIGQSTAQKKIQEEIGDTSGINAQVDAQTEKLLNAIKGLRDLNEKVPDSTGLPAGWKADINKRVPALFKGDAGALSQWEQLNSIGILGGIQSLGLGRLDIPIVKQVQAGGGIPADLPTADRIKMLDNLEAEVKSNQAASHNRLKNLNSPNASTPPQSQMTPYPTNRNQPSPQDIVEELRKRGVIK